MSRLFKKSRRFFRYYKKVRFHKVDFALRFFFSSFGRAYFRRKVFRAKKLLLFFLNRRRSYRYLRINPKLLRRRFISERGRLMKSKQLLKRFFFGLRERQLRFYIVKAAKHTRRVLETLAADFLSYMEFRLDSVLWRTGFFLSSRYVRQLIRHNFIRVNGYFISYPSYRLRVGDRVLLDPFVIVRLFAYIVLFNSGYSSFLSRLLRVLYTTPMRLSFSSMKKGKNFRRFLYFLFKLRKRHKELFARQFRLRARFLKRSLLSSFHWLSFSSIAPARLYLLRRRSFWGRLPILLKRSKLFRFYFFTSFLRTKYIYLLRALFFPLRPLLYNLRTFRFMSSSFGVTLFFSPLRYRYPFPMEVRVLFNLYTGFF